MDSVVLDTDVLSYIAKTDSRSSLYSPLIAGKRLCVCFQTIAEIRLWGLTRNWGLVRQQAMDALLTQYLVLPYDEALAQVWAEITAHRRRLGRPIECGDACIAASALRHGASLATHNAAHFTEIPNLKLITAKR
jgi:predicted nucleic acid-binding protein